MEPTKIPCQAKAIMAGLWVDLEASWASASGSVPGSTLGSRRDFLALVLGWFGPLR